MTYKNPQYHRVNNLQLNRLNELCDSFDDRLHSGDSPKIGEFLGRVPADEQAAVFVELLAIDLEFCTSGGFRPEQADYHTRFPQYRSQIEDGFRKIREDASGSDDTSQQKSDTSPYAIPERVGDFRIIREVGRGGMGVVYEAQQESLDRFVALKVLARNVITDGRQRERFDREARAAGRLHHSNIVPVFGVGCDDGVDFLVMQLIRGKPLDAVISTLRELRAEGPSSNLDRAVSLQDVFGVREDHPHSSVSPERVASAAQDQVAFSESADTWCDPDLHAAKPARVETTSFRSSDTFQIDRANSDESAGQSVRSMQYWRELAEVIRAAADALHYAHEQGVLHRDIKPGNLLLDTKGRIWITDFGLAKAENSEDLTHTGQLLGTVKYMPPEAFNGQSSHSGDIYALGLTLYELTALRPAFQAEDQNQMIRLVMHEAPASVRSINSAIPRDLETIVNKAIERDPKNRYATSADFAEDLRRFCSDEPILARRTSPFELAWRWARRHKLVATLSTGLAFVLLAATGVLSVYANRVTGLNSELNENAAQLKTAKSQADIRANESTALAKQAQSALVGMKITNAYGHFKDKKHQRAIVEMQAAWDSDTYGSRETRSHQMRMGALLNEYPDVVGLAISKDSQTHPEYQPWNDLLMVSCNGAAEIWQPSTCEMKARIEHKSTAPPELCSSGELLLTRTANTCQIWHINSGEVLRTLDHDDRVEQAVFSPDGKTVATACAAGIIRFWDVSNGTMLEQTIKCEHESPAYLDYIDNDRIMASNDAEHVRVWSTADGQPLTEPLLHRPSKPYPPEITLADERIATIDGSAWSIWDLNDGAPLGDFEIPDTIQSVHFCEHGGDVLVSAPSRVKTWHFDFLDGSKKDPAVNILTNPRQSDVVAISSGGDLAATKSTGGTTLVWNLRTLKVIEELENVQWLRFADYRTIVATGHNMTRILRLRHRHRTPVTEPVESTFSAWRIWQTGKAWSIHDANGDRELHFESGVGSLLDGHGNEIRRFSGEDSADSFSARFTRNGSRLLTIADSTYSVWDSETGIQIGRSLPVPEKTKLQPSADGSRVALRFSSKDAAVWDVETEEFVLDGRQKDSNSNTGLNSTPWCLSGDVDNCVLAPNGKYVVVTNDESWNYHIIDVDTRKVRFIIDRHEGAPQTVQITPDSRRFITANSDTTVRVWDAGTGLQVGPYFPHPTFARAAAISDDGALAGTIDKDLRIRTWDIQTGEQVGLPVHASRFDTWMISFAEDSSRLIDSPVRGKSTQHHLPRLRLDREASRKVAELVTNLADTGSGRSETLSDAHMKDREKHMAAWKKWRQGLESADRSMKVELQRDLLLCLADDFENPAVFGNWSCDGQVLISDESRFARIELPIEPEGSYRISMKFTRRSGNDHIGIQLPTSNGRTLLVVDSFPQQGRVALEGIDGRIKHKSGQIHGPLATLGQERLLDVTVKLTGPHADITATLDGDVIYQWSGESRRLILQESIDVHHPERPAIQTHMSRFEFRDVKFTDLP